MPSVAVRLANVVGAPLKGLVAFDVDRMLDDARRLTGLSDFGGDEFLEPLRLLAAGLGSGGRLSFMGRLLSRRELVRCLIMRLKIAEYCRRNPGIVDVPVPDPVVIVGLPRSGTTFLQRLLAQDQRTRTFRLWELYSPVPTGYGDPNVPDTRLKRLQRGMARHRKLLYSAYGRTVMDTIHLARPELPEECIPLLQISFCSAMFGHQGAGAQYSRWFRESDQTTAYRYYRLQLQILFAGQPSARLLVKQPGHLLHLDELLRVFPGAQLLWLHRKPVEVVPSICSLTMRMRALLVARQDPNKVGRRALQNVRQWYDKALDSRQRLKPDQYMDLDYRELVADPLATAGRVYDYLGWETGAEWENALSAYLKRDRAARQGWRYKPTPEHFGLTAEEIRAAFQDLADRLPPYALG
ncbi:MAG: sulfotransferase family protein [Bryobacteraceae bacterium]